MIIEFRCPTDGKLLAHVDDACPRVQVKCERCGQIREYTNPKLRLEHVAVDRRQRTVV